MTVNAADLPASVRKKYGLDVTATGQAKRRRTTRDGMTTRCVIYCHACGAECLSDAQIEKHGKATGHARYEVRL